MVLQSPLSSFASQANWLQLSSRMQSSFVTDHFLSEMPLQLAAVAPISSFQSGGWKSLLNMGTRSWNRRENSHSRGKMSTCQGQEATGVWRAVVLVQWIIPSRFPPPSPLHFRLWLLHTGCVVLSSWNLVVLLQTGQMNAPQTDHEVTSNPSTIFWGPQGIWWTSSSKG